MMLKYIPLIAGCFILSLNAHAQNKSESEPITFKIQVNGTASESENKDITYISTGDKALNKAMEEARDSFDDFLKVVKDNSKNPRFSAFSVKLGFESARYGREHMWVSNIFVEDDELKGILFNTPLDKNIKYKEGDTVVIEKPKVSDWMYTETTDDNKQITRGAYTIRASRNKMSTEEKADFDANSGLRLED